MSRGGKHPDQLEAMALTLTRADMDHYLRMHSPPANWPKWAHCPKAELWQCVALSFGIEPVDATMRPVLTYAAVRHGPKPRTWFAQHGEMRERLDVALANAGLDVLSKLHPLPSKQGDMASRMFSTSEFGAWARSIWGAEIPAEFPGYLSTTGDPANTTEPMRRSVPAPASETAVADDDWKGQARDAARELIKRQAARDLYPSQISIADEVAADFRKRGIFGTDGKPLSGANIKRNALKGISSAKKKAQSTTFKRGK